MASPATFPYVNVAPAFGLGGLMPLVPIMLRIGQINITEDALVDSGATVSVLPDDQGVRLGRDWNAIQRTVPLGGVMSGATAKPVFVEGHIGSLAPVRLAFAWTQWPDAPLILGQTNFFMEFDVCFFRTRGEFQIQPRTP